MAQQYALDVNGNRVFIEKASTMNDYFCEACNGKMIVKKGFVRLHHFAHAASAKCTDSWHYDDKSVWHRNWQNRFPEQCREVYKEYRGGKHRADVLLEKNKIVIEFQHSNLSAEEFKKRNAFYRGLGYRIVWLFDLSEHFENGYFIFEKNEGVCWDHPLKTFKDFTLKDNGIELFFQIEYPADENDLVQSINKIGMSDAFGPESEQYFFEHKNDKGKIIRVAKIATDGIDYFYTDPNIHSIDSWIQMVTNVKSFEPNVVNFIVPFTPFQ